jgi:hypothetical protein
VKTLKKRRTLNQRTLSDADKADRHAKASEAKASRYEKAFKQSFTREISGDIERAAADERESELQAELAVAKGELEETQQLRDKYKAVAEPSKEKFFKSGHYTADVDLTALEVISNLGVSACVVPALFCIFGAFFGVKIPEREKKVQGPTGADGKRTYIKRTLPYIPSKTHCKELPAIGGELHKIQAGVWLLDDIGEYNYCYIADGANSQQKEILAQIMSRRNKLTGKLESMAISIDEISDKSSAGQHMKYTSALSAIAEAWAEADALGLLDSPDFDDALPPSPDTPTPCAHPDSMTAAEYMEQQRKERRAELRWKLRGKIEELRPTDGMNDRAAPARKAARMARGGDGTGGAGGTPHHSNLAQPSPTPPHPTPTPHHLQVMLPTMPPVHTTRWPTSVRRGGKLSTRG